MEEAFESPEELCSEACGEGYCRLGVNQKTRATLGRISKARLVRARTPELLKNFGVAGTVSC